MLYISSRSKTDSFTSYRTLCDDRAPDGGVFIPYKLPDVSDQLRLLKNRSFAENIAYIFNLFFPCKLTPRDVEICVGKNPLRITEMSHRLIMAEGYHNPSRNYSYIENNIYRLIASDCGRSVPSEWFRIASRIAALFAAYGQLSGASTVKFDVCAYYNDFVDPMAAWYAKKMGLPIENIICCCKDKGALWDLIQRGEVSTASAFPGGEINQVEGLIYCTLGLDGVINLLGSVDKNTSFKPDTDKLPAFRDSFTVSVVGSERIAELIRSVKGINNYVINDTAAVCYGGVQDYRAASGKSRDTLIFVDSLSSL